MSEGNSCRTEYLLAQGVHPKHNCSSLYTSSGQFLNLSNILSESLQSAPRRSDDLWKCSDSVFLGLEKAARNQPLQSSGTEENPSNTAFPAWEGL